MIVESKKFNAYLLSELKKELGKEILVDVRIVLSKNVGRTRYNLYFYIQTPIQTPNQYLAYKYSFNEGWMYDAISNNDEDVLICIFERITEGLTLLYNDINFNNF